MRDTWTGLEATIFTGTSHVIVSTVKSFAISHVFLSSVVSSFLGSKSPSSNVSGSDLPSFSVLVWLLAEEEVVNSQWILHRRDTKKEGYFSRHHIRFIVGDKGLGLQGNGPI